MANHGSYKARFLNVERSFSTRKAALQWARRWSRAGGHPVWVTGPDWGPENHTTYIREVR